jgi:hypothetical protein
MTVPANSPSDVILQEVLNRVTRRIRFDACARARNFEPVAKVEQPLGALAAPDKGLEGRQKRRPNCRPPRVRREGDRLAVATANARTCSPVHNVGRAADLNDRDDRGSLAFAATRLPV